MTVFFSALDKKKVRKAINTLTPDELAKIAFSDPFEGYPKMRPIRD
jgi:hypothetical protein